MAIALDLPRAVAMGLPDPNTARQIREAFFGDFPNWPRLMQQILGAVALVLGTLAIGTMILSRRKTTILHALRGIAGIGGLLLAIALLTVDFRSEQTWGQVSQWVRLDQTGPAMDAFLEQFRTPAPIVSAGICLVSLLILSVPARRRIAMQKGVS